MLKRKIMATGLLLYDMNVKVNYELGKRDRLFISGYFEEIFVFSDNFNFDF